MGSRVEGKSAASTPVYGAGEQGEARQGAQVFYRSEWKWNSANFAWKLSEKPHKRAKRLTIRRLIAT